MADILDLDVRGEDMAIDDVMEEDPAAVVEMLKSKVQKRKGRGFGTGASRDTFKDDVYEELPNRPADDILDVPAQRSEEGWILVVTGIHEEAHEDDVQQRFSEFGEIKNLHLNLDRRSGFLKGYALVEYEHFKEAKAAKDGLDEEDLLGNKLKVEWAFLKKSFATNRRNRRRN